MRTRKHVLTLLFLVSAVSAITMVVTMRIRGQKHAFPAEEEQATPATGEMSERQRRHSKLYAQRPRRRDFRKAKESQQVIVSTPWAEAEDNTSQTLNGLLETLTCSADLAVVGTITGKTSQFTEDYSFVFTDYDVLAEQVLRNSTRTPTSAGDSIVLTRPGGAVGLGGKVFRVIDESFTPLEKGKRYLLLLRQVPTTGTYRAINSESSFELGANEVRRLTKKQLPYPFVYANDPASFLARVRAAANLCSGAGEVVPNDRAQPVESYSQVQSAPAFDRSGVVRRLRSRGDFTNQFYAAGERTTARRVPSTEKHR